MIQISSRGDYYLRTYELICNKCGKKPIREGNLKECKKYVKENRWVCMDKKFPNTVHFCRKCYLEEWKEVKLGNNAEPVKEYNEDDGRLTER